MMIRPGTPLAITETGQRVTVWSPAPGPGHYWAHLNDEVVLISVRAVRGAAHPLVKIEEDHG